MMSKVKANKEIRKEFSFCSVVFQYYKKSKVLVLRFLKSNKLFFSTAIPHITKDKVKHFIGLFNESNAKEIIAFNVSIL